jgi:serine/threonine-protein kinase
MVADKFRVERLVGRGGMGFVVEATNVQLGQRVALKFLSAGGGDPAMVERFKREAQAAVKLRSEHVARVFDVGADPERGPFMVMELLDGSNLAEVLGRSGRLPIQRARSSVPSST